MNIDVQDKLGPGLSRLASEMEGEGRTRLSQAMGSEVRLLIVGHLSELAQSRHTTANRLGAEPTGFISQLAENFDQSSTVEVDEDGVSITMRHPVIARAYRDITIVPTSGEFLTIPLNAAAYGHRVGEFDQFVLINKERGSGNAERGTKKAEQPERDESIPAFLLVRSVTQRRDPSLMPSGDEMLTAAAKGAGREIKTILQESGLL